MNDERFTELWEWGFRTKICDEDNISYAAVVARARKLGLLPPFVQSSRPKIEKPPTKKRPSPELRTQIIVEAKQAGVADVAQKYGFSKQAIYRWLSEENSC